MANIDYTIKKLNEQRGKVLQGDLEVWLNTTYSFIEDYFKSYSTRARNFYDLISDFKIKKIGDDYGSLRIDQNYFRSKGIQYIDECIQFLKETKEIEIKSIEDQKTKQMAKHVKTFEEFHNSSAPGPKVIPAPPLEPKVKTQLPFGIPGALFWTIFVAIVGASFFLGNELGKSKFDKEKIDYYNESNKLKSRTDSLTRELNKLKEELIEIKKNKTDSK